MVFRVTGVAEVLTIRSHISNLNKGDACGPGCALIGAQGITLNCGGKKEITVTYYIAVKPDGPKTAFNVKVPCSCNP